MCGITIPVVKTQVLELYHSSNTKRLPKSRRPTLWYSTSSQSTRVQTILILIQRSPSIPVYAFDSPLAQKACLLSSFCTYFARLWYASPKSSPSSSFSSLLAAFFPSLFSMIMTTLVGRFVLAAAPSSARELTNMKGTLWSSQSTGMWLITSAGEMSPAMMTMPGNEVLFGADAADLRRVLTTSLTPRLRVLALAATFPVSYPFPSTFTWDGLHFRIVL